MKKIILFLICLIATLEEEKTFYCHLKEYYILACYENNIKSCGCIPPFVDERKYEFVYKCHTPPYYPACKYDDVTGDIKFCFCVY